MRPVVKWTTAINESRRRKFSLCHIETVDQPFHFGLASAEVAPARLSRRSWYENANDTLDLGPTVRD